MTRRGLGVMILEPLGLSAGGGFGFEFWAGGVRTGLELEVLFVLSERSSGSGGPRGGELLPAIDSDRARARTDICTHYCYYLMLVSPCFADAFIIPFY
jgi:hypothetical protein